MNCLVNPATTDADAGVTLSETSSGSVMVKVALAETPDRVAVMVAWPVCNPLARPRLTVAFVLSDVHEARNVKSCVLPSVKVPFAVNWRVRVAGTVA